ncbi:MAG: AAA family ATPase [Thermoplasmata archaeon]
MSHHVLVSGPSGSGKTHLAQFFRQRGKNAIDADLSGIGIWIDRDGRPVETPIGLGRAINRWAEERHLEWTWDDRRLGILLSRDVEVFVFGGSVNVFELAGRFDRRYYLQADASLVRSRLTLRRESKERDHDFGSTEAQIDYVISRLAHGEERAKANGFELVDAALSTDRLFETICARRPAAGR